MNEGKNTQQQLARLERVLDIFGADADRWPAHERGALRAFIETNPDARQLLGEARALARVLDAAPASKASAPLKARIVAAAIEDTGRGARVIPIHTARSRSVQAMPARRVRAMWPAAALAASFAFGLYLGVAGIGATVVDGAFQVASNSGEDTIFWLEDGAGVGEEGPL